MAIVVLLLGVATAMGLSPVISSLFYDMNPVDPAILLGVGSLLAVIALVYGCYPATRAARRDPTELLCSD